MMTDDKLELFKPEDGRELFSKVYFGQSVPRWITIEHANRILNERLSVGYCQVPNDLEVPCFSVDTTKFSVHTHRIYYLTQILEEEKAECEHIRYRLEPAKDKYSIYKFDNIKNDYCPKCREPLNDT